jgi:hypothetical protein
MSIPILIHQENGHFTATVLGAPDFRVTAGTREIALMKIKAALKNRVTGGELVFVDVAEPEGILAIAGTYRDDESLREICDEIYRQRDAEPKE